MDILLTILGITIGVCLGPVIYFYIYPGPFQKKKFEKYQWKEPKAIDDALKMIQKLKQLFPIAAIVWQPEDAIEMSEDEEQGLKRSISLKEAQTVILIIEKYKDCNYGLTWEHLKNAIEDEIRMNDKE